MTSAPELFTQNQLRDVFNYHLINATEKIDSIPRDQLLATPVDDIVSHVTSHFMMEGLTIDEAGMRYKDEETRTDAGPRIAGDRVEPHYIHGTRVSVLLPFFGNGEFWKFAPGTSITGPRPRGVVHVGPEVRILEMVFDHPEHESPEQLRDEVGRNLHLIKQYLAFQRSDVDQYHRDLPKHVLAKVNQRRERLLKQLRLREILALPLALSPDAVTLKPLPLQKRIIHPLPPPPKQGYQPEPGITDQDYKNILSILRHVGRTFEVTPKTYSIHDEEELRDIMLAHLNGHYQGLATGETFRRAGKTDIRIEDKQRAAFVAECKVWNGPKTVTESLDQLLEYLTWRDCKTAIILFNKDVAGFTELLGKVEPTVKVHPRFMKAGDASASEGEWQFVIRSQDDPARLIHIHIFLLDLFTRPDDASNRTAAKAPTQD